MNIIVNFNFVSRDSEAEDGMDQVTSEGPGTTGASDGVPLTLPSVTTASTSHGGEAKEMKQVYLECV